ncbi:MAG: hypothetical protein AAFN41_08180 [Planctomycetota bacterium]
MRTIERLIRRAWWRLVLADVLRTSAITLAVAGGVLFVWRMLSLVAPAPATWSLMLGVGAGLAIVAAIVWSVLRVKQGEAVARRLDENAGLRESLSTAIAVGSLDDAWSKAAVSQAERVAAGVDLGKTLPIESPRAWPAPLAAWGVLAVALALPAPDLTAVLGEPAQVVAEREIIEAKAEVDQTTEALKEQAERLGLKLDFDEETPGEEVGAPDQQTPEQIRAAAVKKLTKLGDELAEKMDSQEQQAREALENRLQRLRQPGPGPAEDLARSLARGEFGKAKEALDELEQKLREGDLDESQREMLEKQLANLSKQMEQLGERQSEMEAALQQAGMSSEQAKQMASNPDALKQALENMQNLSETQKQQLQQMAESAAQSQQMMQNMSGAMSQMAQAMQQGQMGQMSEGMGQLSDQLSQMEMLSADMAGMQAMMQQMQGQAFALGQAAGSQGGMQGMPGMGEGQGRWNMGDTSRQGNGSGGPGQGNGDSPAARETSFSTTAAKSAVKTTDGPIIGSTLVYESQVRGESRATFAAAAQSASASAADAIESMRVPRAYERAVQRYFGALEREAAGDAAEAETTEGE